MDGLRNNMPRVHWQIIKNTRYLHRTLRKYKPLKGISVSQCDKKKKVIVFGLRTFVFNDDAVFEKIISDAFSFQGALVKTLICNNALSSCDMVFENSEAQSLECQKCYAQRKDFMRFYPGSYIYFQEFLSLQDIKAIQLEVDTVLVGQYQAYQYKNVPVGRYAEYSLMRYSRTQLPDVSMPKYQKYYRHCLIQAMMAVKVGEQLLLKERPSHFFSVQRNESSWGPICDYLSQNGVCVVSYDARKETSRRLVFSRNMTQKETLECESWKQFLNRPLREKEKERVYQFLFEEQTGNVKKPHHDGELKKNKVLHLIQEKSEGCKYKYVLFVPSLRDKAVRGAKKAVFDDAMDWIMLTIDHFSRYSNLNLVIFTNGSDNTLKDLENVLRKNVSVPRNVNILPESHSLNVVDFIKSGWIGLVYNGIQSLQYAYCNMPALVVGEQNSVTYPISSKNAYFRALNNPEPVIDYAKKKKELAEKVCFYYYFYSTWEIPFFKKNTWLRHSIDWEVIENYPLFIKNNFVIKTVAQTILNGLPILLEYGRKPLSIPRNRDGKVRVHLGPGDQADDRYINVDSRALPHIHKVASVTNPNVFPSHYADFIYACHVLEHISYHDTLDTLKLWRSWLKKDGLLRLSVPDFDKIVKLYMVTRRFSLIRAPLMGGQGYKENSHFAVFNYKELSELLKQAGFKNVRKWSPNKVNDYHFHDWAIKKINWKGLRFKISLNIEAEA